MSKASNFLRTLLGAAKSNTMQTGGLFLILWTAVYQSDFIRELVVSNPEYAALAGGLNAVLMLLLRVKTDKPLSDR